MKHLFLIFFLLFVGALYAQTTIEVVVKDKDTGAPLPGAPVVVGQPNDPPITGEDGRASVIVPDEGATTITVSYVGYETVRMSIEPSTVEQPLVIYLDITEELEEVVVTATRSSRTIDDEPTRLEVISGEELGEKAVMNSSNIAMLLRESTGILMQQTSANSANQSIRIQGLDGRYTQILRDGFPLYGGFSSGLSIMQVPPLDLRQVEVIKGSSSTLYGGGAIAGLVNLVTKTPEERPAADLMFNQTSAGGTTVNGFYSQKYGKVGATLYTSLNRQSPYDPNEDGFSDIPKVRSLTFNPKLFWYPNDSATVWVGLNTTFEDRMGGDLEVIDGRPDSLHSFFERNLSKRSSVLLYVDRKMKNNTTFTFKNSINFFNRDVTSHNNLWFNGKQNAGFSEAAFLLDREKHDWIFGANLFLDKFNGMSSNAPSMERLYLTPGVFVQDTWELSPSAVLEAGARIDYNTDYGWFTLPRASLLFRFSEKLTGRFGGGMGYKLPSEFNEETESRIFNIQQLISRDQIVAEKSYGGNFDIDFKTPIGSNMTFSVNQLFYYTRLTNPIVTSFGTGPLIFSNGSGIIDSRGIETNTKFTVGDLKLFLQYALIDVLLDYDGLNRQKSLTPRHNAGAVLMYEQHHKWRIGFEMYYTGKQTLSDYTITRDYLIAGVMAMREFHYFSLFLNFENFPDTRQTRYEDIVIPPYNDPAFAEIWAPTDGFVINGGFIIKLFGGED